MGTFDLNRRKFLGALTLGTAHLMFHNPLYGNTGRFSSVDPLQRVALGLTGIKPTLLGMGTGISGGSRNSFLTRQERAKSVATIRHAYDRGIRMFDNADTYGTHGLIAEALKGMEREELVLTSKIWTREGGIPEKERPDANIVVDRFRKELNTDYIDVVQIHCMVEPDWTDHERRQMDILEELKVKGIIRAHGVSVHTLEAMKSGVADPWVDVLHARINPFGIAMDRPDPAEVVEVIHQMHASGRGVIGMKLVGNGDLRNESEKIDQSLKFVLGLNSVDMVIVGFESEAQIDNYLDRMGVTLKELA
ncbi:MAG: aldo/keto reductase [Bacteroidales bacterium]|nr:aldo/keto reductase [Bacteroidales bacterium]